MAIRPLNSVGGFAVGELANVVVLPNGVITTSTANLTANLIANAVYTDNYKYANGTNVDFQTAAGNATEIQFKATGANDLAASANLTFDNANSLLNLVGTANISTVNVLGAGNAFYVANSLRVDGTIYGNISGNLSAAGTDTQVLFNDSGTVNAVSGMTFVKTSNLLTVSGNIDVQNLSNANLLSANYISINNDANVSGTLNTANISVGGNIVPNANVTYSLGNNTNRFKDLWLSGNTIELGGANIKADGSNVTITTALGGTFTVNGTQNANSGYIVNGTSNVLVSPNSSVTVSAQGNANVFTVTGNGVSVTGTLAAGDTTITGNLTVTGTTTSVNSTVTQIVDPMFELGGGANGAALTTDDNKERGMLMHYYKGSAPVNAFMGWMNGNSEFAFGSNVTVTDNNVTINTLGNIRAGNANLGNLATANYVNVTANLTSGNASLGNLASANYVNVSANLTSGNANLGNLASANYINVATDLTVGTGTGGNITGANLISANYVNVSSNLTAGNANLGNLASVNYLTINNAITIPDMIADNIVGHKANVIVSSNTVIDTFTATKYRAAKYVIKASNDTGYQVLEAIIVHDNADSYATIYGSISTTASDIVEIDTYIVGSNIELKANAVTASANTKVRLLGTYIAD